MEIMLLLSLKKIVNFVVVYVCLYIYIHNLPTIGRLGSWCLKKN